MHSALRGGAAGDSGGVRGGGAGGRATGSVGTRGGRLIALSFYVLSVSMFLVCLF